MAQFIWEFRRHSHREASKPFPQPSPTTRTQSDELIWRHLARICHVRPLSPALGASYLGRGYLSRVPRRDILRACERGSDADSNRCHAQRVGVFALRMDVGAPWQWYEWPARLPKVQESVLGRPTEGHETMITFTAAELARVIRESDGDVRVALLKLATAFEQHLAECQLPVPPSLIERERWSPDDLMRAYGRVQELSADRTRTWER